MEWIRILDWPIIPNLHDPISVWILHIRRWARRWGRYSSRGRGTIIHHMNQHTVWFHWVCQIWLYSELSMTFIKLSLFWRGVLRIFWHKRDRWGRRFSSTTTSRYLHLRHRSTTSNHCSMPWNKETRGSRNLSLTGRAGLQPRRDLGLDLTNQELPRINIARKSCRKVRRMPKTKIQNALEVGLLNPGQKTKNQKIRGLDLLPNRWIEGGTEENQRRHRRISPENGGFPSESNLEPSTGEASREQKQKPEEPELGSRRQSRIAEKPIEDLTKTEEIDGNRTESQSRGENEAEGSRRRRKRSGENLGFFSMERRKVWLYTEFSNRKFGC